MPEQLQLMEQARVRSALIFGWMPAASMLVLLTAASWTSNDSFNLLYQRMSQSLWLGKTSLALWLLAHPEIGHFLGYALLSLTLSGMLARQRMYIAPLAAGIVGVILEAGQIFIPTRGASFLDIGVNFLGVAVGFGVYFLWVRVVRSEG